MGIATTGGAFDRAKIGSELQSLRKEKGYVLRDLVDNSLSLTTLSRIEQGHPHASIQKYTLYAEKLGEQLEDIINRETHKEHQNSILRYRLRSIEHLLVGEMFDEAFSQLNELVIDHNSVHLPLLHFLTGKCYYLQGEKCNKKRLFQKAKKKFLEAIQLAKANSAQCEHLNVLPLRAITV